MFAACFLLDYFQMEVGLDILRGGEDVMRWEGSYGTLSQLGHCKAAGYELYYNHWCANTLPREFIEAQTRVDVDDNRMAERCLGRGWSRQG